jgi:hypothetical protein
VTETVALIGVLVGAEVMFGQEISTLDEPPEEPPLDEEDDAVIVQLAVAVCAVPDVVSVTLAVNVLTTGVVGVPVIAPVVLLLIDNPAGKRPEVIENV